MRTILIRCAAHDPRDPHPQHPHPRNWPLCAGKGRHQRGDRGARADHGRVDPPARGRRAAPRRRPRRGHERHGRRRRARRDRGRRAHRRRPRHDHPRHHDGRHPDAGHRRPRPAKARGRPHPLVRHRGFVCRVSLRAHRRRPVHRRGHLQDHPRARGRSALALGRPPTIAPPRPSSATARARSSSAPRRATGAAFSPRKFTPTGRSRTCSRRRAAARPSR